MGFKENLKKYRKLNNLTQKELADKIGKKSLVISRYEKGDIAPPVSVIQELANVLNVPANTLMGWETQEENKNDKIYNPNSIVSDTLIKGFNTYIDNLVDEQLKKPLTQQQDEVLSNLILNVKFQEKIIDFLKKKNALLGIKKEDYELEEMADEIIEYIEFVNQKPTKRLSDIEKMILRGKTQD